MASIHISNYPIILLKKTPDPSTQHLKLYTLSCVKPGLDYFISKYTGDLSEQISAFKSARLIRLFICLLLQQQLTVPYCPFLIRLLPSLKTELPTYLALESGVSSDTEPTVWWEHNKANLPNWSLVFTEVVLIQPSMAAAESLLSTQNSFNERQDLAMQDYFEA